MRLEGFAGLRDGLTMITGLVERFWDGLFPEPDDDGMETKVGPIAGLSGSGATGTLSQPIRTLPITRGASARYSLWHYEQAADLEKLTDPTRREARTKAGVISLEQFRQSVKETSAEEMREIFTAVEESQAALETMTQAFRAVAGTTLQRRRLCAICSPRWPARSGSLPPKSRRRGACRRCGGSLHRGRRRSCGARPHGATQVAAPVVRREGFASRDEALAELTKIAAYFRKTEPHSPLSYTIDEAVRRGKLSLPELLAELAQDPAHIKYILLAAGIKELPAS